MTIKIQLNAETEARLKAEVRAQGLPLETMAERLLNDALAGRSLPNGRMSMPEFHQMVKALAEGSEGLPDLPTESFSRESFYEDRLGDRGPYLVDSNILLRWIKPDHGD